VDNAGFPYIACRNGQRAHFLLAIWSIMVVPHDVLEVLRAGCNAAGVVLLKASLRGQLKQLVLDVVVDARQGITHNQCTAVSRYADEHLETHNLYSSVRAVEVSSPGAEAPVMHLWQLEKHIGRIVQVTDTSGVCIQGTLVSIENDHLNVQPQSPKREPKPPAIIRWEDVSEAKVIIVWHDVK
jgi:ribosome maturation factor RimP